MTEPASGGSSATRVVFIAGGGRSGSTLLANALGSLPSTLSAGEVKLAFRRGLLEDGHCGCRMPVRECAVWGPALTATFGSMPTKQEAELLDLRLTAAARTRRVPWWLAGRSSADVDDLADTMARLLAAVAAAAGVRTVVDSSKLPAYGALLARSPRLEVKVVHLVRDPRAVAWSWQRAAASQQVGGFEEDMERLSPAKSSLMWLESSTSVPALWRHDQDNPVTVRYEDVVADPARELRRVAEHADLMADLSFVRDDGLYLDESHAVAGNPNRVRQGPVRLRQDDEWKTAMSERNRTLVSLMTKPRRARHGY